jgi:predicted ribosome quality control (RQC) complex YloA/Tae2 family protein
MAELSSIDVYYAVQELQSFIGAKIEKAYQGERRDIFLHLYCSDGKKRNIRFLSGLVCSPQEKPSYPTQPPGFAMFLRKRICGSRITKIEQVNSDRIISFTCEYKDSAPLTLIYELMPPSNMILVDENNNIINLLEQMQYKDRSLRARQPYVYPPAPYPITTIDTESFAKHIAASTKESIVKTLAMHCGMGGMYAEEACARAGIPKHRNDLNAEETMRIATAVHTTIHQPLMPIAIGDRIYPFPFVSKTEHVDNNATHCNSTFLAALATLIKDDDNKEETKQQKRLSPKNKLQTLIDAQSAQLAALELAMQQDQRKGELIYEHYAHVQQILEHIRHAREKKIDMKTAIAAIQQAHKGIITYNEKNGELTIELEDAAHTISSD